jgi:hypothetical protein
MRKTEMIKKNKSVKIILCDPPSSLCDDNVFMVKKVVNTLHIRVGEYIDADLVKNWIAKDNWTIEFVK